MRPNPTEYCGDIYQLLKEPRSLRDVQSRCGAWSRGDEEVVIGTFFVLTGVSACFGSALRKLVNAGMVRLVQGHRALRLERRDANFYISR